LAQNELKVLGLATLLTRGLMMGLAESMLDMQDSFSTENSEDDSNSNNNRAYVPCGVGVTVQVKGRPKLTHICLALVYGPVFHLWCLYEHLNPVFLDVAPLHSKPTKG
jgi:hypothetical protein